MKSSRGRRGGGGSRTTQWAGAAAMGRSEGWWGKDAVHSYGGLLPGAKCDQRKIQNKKEWTEGNGVAFQCRNCPATAHSTLCEYNVGWLKAEVLHWLCSASKDFHILSQLHVTKSSGFGIIIIIFFKHNFCHFCYHEMQETILFPQQLSILLLRDRQQPAGV